MNNFLKEDLKCNNCLSCDKCIALKSKILQFKYLPDTMKSTYTQEFEDRERAKEMRLESPK